jgi:hypothetical protein
MRVWVNESRDDDQVRRVDNFGGTTVVNPADFSDASHFYRHVGAISGPARSIHYRSVLDQNVVLTSKTSFCASQY